MDDFREWLSDNLRYIMLGMAIIAVLVLLFFGIRFLSSVFGKDKPEDHKVPDRQETQVDGEEGQNQKDDPDGDQKEPDQQGDETVTTPEPTQEPTQEPVKDENPLEKNAYSTVNALMQKYYTALGKRDIQGLKELVDNLDPAEASAIENSRYIEGYSSIEALTKKGLTENSYVVFACYGHKYVGYDTVLPGVSCLYVQSREDGTLYITAEQTSEQQEYIAEVMKDQDVQDFLTEKQKEYDDALEADQALNSYLSELGVEGSAAMEAEEGAVITVKSNCNVRAKASVESEKLGELAAGQEVKKTGQEGEWIQIEFDGKAGYVRGDLFR